MCLAAGVDRGAGIVRQPIAKLDFALCALGYVRCETHRAFNEEEFRKIVSTLPAYETRPS